MTRSGIWCSACTRRSTARIGRRWRRWCRSEYVVKFGGFQSVGWDAWLGQLQEFFAAFPDGRHVIDEVLVDGSHGVSRCRFVGTHTGEFQGIAPTGAKVSVSAIHIDRFQGDSLVAHRGQLDVHGLVQQLKGGSAGWRQNDTCCDTVSDVTMTRAPVRVTSWCSGRRARLRPSLPGRTGTRRVRLRAPRIHRACLRAPDPTASRSRPRRAPRPRSCAAPAPHPPG